MQFKPVLLMVLLTAITSVTAVPYKAKPCDSEDHPCKHMGDYPDCSPEYIEVTKECVKSGCIQWIMDPLRHCYEYDTA